MAIGDDFSIDYDNRIISHSANLTVYSSQQLYSWLQDTFDEQSQMDDTVPMSAQTPTAFTLINGWFIPEVSTRFLDGGSIQTDGWDTVIYIGEGSETTAFEFADIGKEITGSTTGYKGNLLDFQTDNFGTFQVYIRASSSNDTYDTAELLQVSGGVGEITLAAAGKTGETIFTNIYTLGSIVSPTYAYVYQSGSIIDGYASGWWGEGFIDILLKVQEADAAIDLTYLNVFAREYGTQFDNFRLQTGTGRNAVPLSTGTDGFNTSTTESVSAYSSSISITFYTESQQFNLDNGAGAQPYKCVIDCGTVGLGTVYEYTKYITQRVYRDDIDADVANYITGAVYQSVSESNHFVSVFTPNKQAPFGSYTGKFFAARSVWLANLDSADVKNFSLVDDNGTTQDPPNTVSVTVTSVSASDRVAVFRLITAGGEINKNEFQLLSGSAVVNGGNNQSGSYVVCISGTIPTDVPKASVFRISDDAYPFSTWTNGTTGVLSGSFFLTASFDRGWGGSTAYGLTKDYADGSSSYVPFIDKLVRDTDTTATNTIVQSSTIPVLVRVRNGTIDWGILPFEIEQSIGSSGLSVSAIRTTDAINTSS